MATLTTQQIREIFLDFFEKKDHACVESASLIPVNDPTLLFVNAGMVPFKDYFLGKHNAPFSAATSVQRCVRAGGKHNDLENVGYTARHHTFFEMLGNFSFGAYFKKEAISYAWEFLTQVVGLPVDRLWVSVYKDDLETADIWIKDIGVDPDRISYCGKKDNFWSMGDTGPCGPCTEIFYDHGADIPGGPPGTPEEDGDRYIEIWNMVFMQFNRLSNGTLDKLPVPCVDTGMGLERIAAVIQDVHNNYDIDLFQSLVTALDALLPAKHEDHLMSKRVIADHIRSAAFLIADGVVPSNEGRGYVLRRIIRRAVRHGLQLGFTKPFLHKMVAPLVALMGAAYNTLQQQQPYIENIILQEEEQFARTLGNGMKVLSQYLNDLDGNVISGEIAFTMYDTYGFPVDLTADIAREKGLIVDMESFAQHMEQQRAQSKQASQFTQDVISAIHLKEETDFVGYDRLETKAKVMTLLQDGSPVSALHEGDKGSVVLDITPFYPTGGGQIGDTGYLYFEDGMFQVKETIKHGQAIIHTGRLDKGHLKVDTEMLAQVDGKRQAIAANHSATHLLHAALRYVLGDHVQQKGSLVDAKHLRFDFSHHQALTSEEVVEVENLVNQQIRNNLGALIQIMPLKEAKKLGAAALFGEKYQDQVRVLQFGDFSIELCGGTHVDATGEIGLFKIVSEGACASGVRRIDAVTAHVAVDYIHDMEKQLQKACDLMQTDAPHLVSKIEQNVATLKETTQQLQQLKAQGAQHQLDAIIDKGEMINGCYVLTAILNNVDSTALRQMVDQVKSQRDDYVIVLANQADDRIQLVVGVGKSAQTHFNAKDLMAFIAEPLGGKGGGRPDLAQGSGKHADKLQEVISSIKAWIAQQS